MPLVPRAANRTAPRSSSAWARCPRSRRPPRPRARTTTRDHTRRSARADVAMNAVPRAAYGHGFAANFDWSWCPPARREQPIDLRIVLGSLGRFEGADRTAYVPYQPGAARGPARRNVSVARGG